MTQRVRNRWLGVSEPVGVADEDLDDPVDALGAGVGEAAVDEREDLWPPSLDRGGQPLQLWKLSLAQRR